MWLRSRSKQAYIYQPPAANLLLAEPEAGPGYQILRVDAFAVVAQRQRVVPLGDYLVLNAELLLPVEVVFDPQAPSPTDIWQGASSYDAYLQALAPQPLPVTGFAGTLSAVPGTGAATAPTPPMPRSTFTVSGVTVAQQRFWRLSAYAKDKRIVAGELLAGAYVTSDNDYKFINTGLGAVGRLALPNPFPAKYAYPIDPIGLTAFDAGTVRPAFGQAGGGVEVVLRADAPAGGPTGLPDV